MLWLCIVNTCFTFVLSIHALPLYCQYMLYLCIVNTFFTFVLLIHALPLYCQYMLYLCIVNICFTFVLSIHALLLYCQYMLYLCIVNTCFTFVLLNPSAKRMISAIIAESGTTMDIGRNMLLRLSGSSVRPAYPARKARYLHKWQAKCSKVYENHNWPATFRPWF